MSSPKFGESNITAHLIERQVRLWQARRQPVNTGDSPKVGPAPYRFLTIIRDEGSWGDEVAQELSRRLGWHVFDKEIVNYIAENSHVRESLVRQLDERSQGLIQDTIMRLLRMPEYGSFGMEEYHKALLKTLAYLAMQGEAILVGRGANFALRNEESGLHIRIMASSGIRVKRLSEEWKVPPDPVRRCMEAGDANRKNFVRQHFKRDLDDPRYYDLHFNTDHLSIQSVTASILGAVNLQGSRDSAMEASKLSLVPIGRQV